MKTTFDFCSKLTKLLDDLQEELPECLNRAEVIRRALVLLKLTVEVEKANGEIFFVSKEGVKQKITVCNPK